MNEIERKLTAIVSADVAGYTKLMEADEEGTLRRLEVLVEQVIRPAIVANHGRLVKLMGDGILAEFASVVDAVRCFAQAQASIRERNFDVPASQRIDFRVGITVGDVIARDGDIYGTAVNAAARIQALGEPGGLYLSGGAREQVGNLLELQFEDLGEFQLRNIDQPMRVYRTLRAGEVSAAALRSSAPVASSRRGWMPAVLGGGALLAVLAGFGLWWSAERPPAEPKATVTTTDSAPAPRQASIAVLPFSDLSPGQDQEYFSDGIAEELLNVLVRIKGLKVASRTSSFSFKERQVNLKTIADELGVANILEGSVRKAGNRVRITAQLISAHDDSHLWSETFERQMNDVFSIQDEIAQAIVSALKVRLIGEEKKELRSARTDNVKAYDLYLLGRYHLHQRTPESLARAVELFEQVVALDPRFALAHSGLADAYLLTSWYGNMSTAVATAKAGASVLTAIQLDEKLAEAYASQGLLHMRLGNDAAAEAVLRRAVELNPGYSMAHMWLGNTLNRTGRYREGHESHLAALSLDPLHPTIVENVADGYLRLGRPQAAIKIYESNIRAAGPSSRAYRSLAGQYAESGQLAKSFALVRKAIEIEDTDPLNLLALSWAQAQLGDFDEAQHTNARIAKLSPHNFAAHLAPVQLLIMRGDVEAATVAVKQLLARASNAMFADFEVRTVQAVAGHVALLGRRFAEAQQHLKAALGGGYDSGSQLSISAVDDLALIGWLGHCYSKTGNVPGVREMVRQGEALITRLRQGGRADPGLHYYAARQEIVDGRHDVALQALRTALDQGWWIVEAGGQSYGGYWDLLRDPTWDPLRDDPRFQAMLAELRAIVERERKAAGIEGALSVT